MTRFGTLITTVSASLAAALLLAPAASSKEVCAPKITSPNDGAVTSTTPRIQATAKSAGNCTPNAKKVILEVTHVESGNKVYEHTKTRGKGLTTGRAFYTGMNLLDHEVPSGELGEGETYEVYVEYPDTGVFAGFDEHVGCCMITFSTREDGGGEKQALRGQANHTIVIRGTGGGTDYRISGGGELEQVSGSLDGHQISKQAGDNVSGNRAQGRVVGGNDGFKIYGAMPEISLENPENAVIYVDGEKQARSGRDYHTIVVSGHGGTDYRIHGGGRLEQVSGALDGHRVSKQKDDNVIGNRAEGHVGSGKDGFKVYGSVPEVKLDSPANAVLYIDGRRQ